MKIKKYRKEIGYSILVCLVILITVFTIVNKPESAFNDSGNSLTLKEAYDLSFSEALKWNEKAMLAELITLDDSEGDNVIDGSDGKRKSWNTLYNIPGTDTSYHISIRNGQVDYTRETEDGFLKEDLIDRNSVKIDSLDALEMAQEYYNLKPGKNWA